jgi:hypothetical protein
MAFTDLVGSYLQNRMDTATRPFTDPSGYAADRFNSAFPSTTMETEEERRKRLEREAAERGNTEVASTTVKSYADGSQEEVKKTQIPAPQEAPAPQAAPAPGPVDPNTYQRMLQAESGNRQLGPDGQIMTSPKGALGAGQIMPSTAMQPGYGVPSIFDMAQQQGIDVPARDEATARQLLGNEQLNRQFGQNYFNAMQQRFPQDPAASVAAYNAGPGRVGQNMQANAGQLNRSQLPQETQAYLQKTLGGQAPQQAQAPAQAIAPEQATAAPAAPAQPVNPEQAPASPMIAGTPTSDVGLTPTEQALKQQQAWQTDLKNAENDIDSLYTIAGDKSGRYTPEVKQIARDRALQADKAAREKQQAETLSINAAKGDPKATNEMMRKLREKSEEGSYFKAYLYSRFGLNDLAQEEQQKLAGPKFAQALVDGKQYFVETKGGAIVGAFDDTGARIKDDATLARINTNYTKQGTQQFGFTGEPGIVTENGKQYEVRQRTNSTTGKIENIYVTGPKAGERYTGSEIPMAKSVNTSAAKATNAANIDIAAAAPQAYNKAAGGSAGAFNQANAANQPVNTMGSTVANPAPLGGPQVPQAVPGMSAPAQPGPVNPAQVGVVPQVAPQPAPARVAPAASAKVPGMPQFKEPGFENETPADFEARRTSAAAANKPIIEAEANKQYAAQNVYPIVKDINEALKTATGSGIGAKVDDIAAWFGKSTEGAKAIAQLEVLGDTLLKAVPRFSGPQSDKDVASYMAAAGKLADAKTPVATRAAAFKTIVDLNKKYAPDLDWSFKDQSKDESLFKSADEIIARGKKK